MITALPLKKLQTELKSLYKKKKSLPEKGRDFYVTQSLIFLGSAVKEYSVQDTFSR